MIINFWERDSTAGFREDSLLYDILLTGNSSAGCKEDSLLLLIDSR